MAFWSEKGVEPKRSFRWLLYWSGVPQFIVKSVKKPSFGVMTKHQFLTISSITLEGSLGTLSISQLLFLLLPTLRKAFMLF